MNQLLLVVVALGLFVYFGGNNVPKVLRDNKDMLLGVVVGLVLCSFMGMRLEGVVGSYDPTIAGEAAGQGDTPQQRLASCVDALAGPDGSSADMSRYIGAAQACHDTHCSDGAC